MLLAFKYLIASKWFNTELTELQSKSPEGYPYVLVPPSRYDHIQQLRKQGRWQYSDARNKVIHNFTRLFEKVLKKAGVKKGTFHDLRRTALRNWLSNGVSEYDVMTLAGHSKFETTHKFYLSVADGLVDRARKASSNMSKLNFGARMVQEAKIEFDQKNKAP